MHSTGYLHCMHSTGYIALVWFKNSFLSPISLSFVPLSDMGEGAALSSFA